MELVSKYEGGSVPLFLLVQSLFSASKELGGGGWRGARWCWLVVGVWGWGWVKKTYSAVDIHLLVLLSADVLKVRLQMQLVGQRGPLTGMVWYALWTFTVLECFSAVT